MEVRKDVKDEIPQAQLREVIILESDSTATVISPKLYNAEEVVYKRSKDSLTFGNKRYKIDLETEDRLHLVSATGDTFVDLLVADPHTIHYFHRAPYRLRYDGGHINLGAATDTVAPYTVPVEVYGRDGELLHAGFTSLQLLGNRQEVLHSELFTLAAYPSENGDQVAGYLFDSLYPSGLQLIEMGELGEPGFTSVRLPTGTFINRARISLSAFRNGELGYRSRGMTLDDDAVALKNDTLYQPKIRIAAGGSVTLHADSPLAVTYAHAYRSNYSPNIFLLSGEETAIIQQSGNRDTLFVDSYYNFGLDDGGTEGYGRRDTFVRQ